MAQTKTARTAKISSQKTRSKHRTGTRAGFADTAGSNSLDSVYILKLLMFMVIGSQWVRFTDAEGVTVLPLPLGFIIGLLFAAHEHFQVDRKIEYAVLLVAMFIGFWTQAGIYIRF